jgi:Tfp pilus assembly protein PilO
MKPTAMPTKNRQQLLTVVALSAAALFAGDKLIVSRLQDAWVARSKQIAELTRNINEGKLLQKRETSLRNHWDDMRRNTLPTDTSSAEQQIWSAFDRWVQDSHVAISAVTPQWKRDSEDYETYECRVEATGNINSLTVFLYDIEKDAMALKLESLEMGTKDKEGQQLTMNLVVSALALTPQPQ